MTLPTSPTPSVDVPRGAETVTDVLVIGAGQAGAEVVSGLRRGGHDGAIRLVGDETLPPYERPPLSKAALATGLQIERLSLRAPHVYADLRVDIDHGRRAVHLDSCGHRVTFDDGSVVRYTNCVLATGARAVPPPWPSRHRIHAVRTFGDALRLRTAVHAGARSCLIVGGGYLGLEIASSLLTLGLDVTVVEAGTSLLPGKTSPFTAKWLLDRHRGRGLRVHVNCLVTELTENPDAVVVGLRDGSRLTVDMVVFATGAVPNVELAAADGAECGRGVFVDQAGRTSLTDVYAAGDVASFRTPGGLEARIESVHNAVNQAKAVVTSLLGQPEVSTSVPTFWTEQAGIRLQQAGWLPPDLDTHDVVAATDEELTVERYLAGALVAVETVGRPADFLRLAKSLTDLRFIV